MKTLQEETVEGIGVGRNTTRRVVNGKSCYLMHSTTNKEEAITEFKSLQKHYKKDDWRRRFQFAKLSIMSYGFGIGKVYLVWGCWR